MTQTDYYFLIITVALEILKAKTSGQTSEVIGELEGSERILQAALAAHAAVVGKTQAEVIAGLQPYEPINPTPATS